MVYQTVLVGIHYTYLIQNFVLT